MLHPFVCGAAAALALAASCLGQIRFPPPIGPTGNPVTAEKALLGMALFWDEQMSSSNSVACATCHQFSAGGTDPLAGQVFHPGPDGQFHTQDDIAGSPSLPARQPDGRYAGDPAFGVGMQVTRRKAPTVINAAYHVELFWDGRAGGTSLVDPVTNQTVLTGFATLENVVLQPPVNAREMAHNGRTWSDVIARLQTIRPLALATEVPERLRLHMGSARYPELFEAAFGTPGITASRVAMAIATYMRTLIADDSRFDRFLAGTGQLTPLELQGMQLFQTATANAASCVSCHGDVSLFSHTHGPRTSLEQSTPPPYYGPPLMTQNYANIGVRPIADDPGRSQGAFKVPALRNVALHTTLFHNGSAPDLTAAIEFYDRGGDHHTNQSTSIRPRAYTQGEKDALVAFLRSLTDARVQNGTQPFDHPRLTARSSVPVSYGTGMPGRDNRTPRAISFDPVFAGNAACTIALTDVPPGLLALTMWDLYPSPGITLFGLRFELGLGSVVLGAGAMTSAAGHASVTFGIPDRPQLRGLHLYQQWLLVDPTLATGACTSTALDLTIR